MSVTFWDEEGNEIKGVAALKRLEAQIEQDDQGRVVELKLMSLKITDAGLEHLKGLTSLQTLTLARTKITGAGLVHLKGLTKLRLLGVVQTQVSDAGVADMRKALPNCEIIK